MSKDEDVKPMPPEPLGSPVTWLRKFHAGIENGEVSVPCGTCDSCCRDFDEIFLTEDEAQKYEHTIAEDGRPLLARNDTNTQCYYLDDEKGCQTYEDRPLNCRQFDCRALAHCGVFPVDFPRVNAAVQHWEVDASQMTEEEKVLGLSLRMAARAAVEIEKKDPFQAAAAAVFGGFGLFAREATALVRRDAQAKAVKLVDKFGKPFKKH